MEIIISARHFEVTDELRQHVQRRVGKLAEEWNKLTTARVVLSLVRNWQLAEVHVNGKQLDLEGQAQTDDMYTSVDEAADKVEKQLRRHLEKLQQHRREMHLSEALKEEPPEEEDVDEELEDDMELEPVEEQGR